VVYVAGVMTPVWCVKQNVLDGDLCEMFNALDASKQKTVAEELDRTPSEVRPGISCVCT